MTAIPSSAPSLPDAKVLAPAGVSLFFGPPGDAPLKGTLIELAPKDLLFAPSKQFPVGTMLNLHLHVDQLPLKLFTLGMVHWSSEVDSRLQCGVFLRNEIPREWLERFWEGGRNELRFSGQWIIRAWSEMNGESRDVVVGNYSRNGAQFLTHHPIEDGTSLCIGTPDNYVKAVVRWCSEADEHCYRVGCQLERDSGVRLASILRFSAFDL